MPGIYFLFRGVEEMRHHSFSGVTVGEQQPLGQRKGSMAFKDLSATTIAEQLTFLEYRMLRRIPVRISHFLFIFFLGCFFFSEMEPYHQGSLFGAGAKNCSDQNGQSVYPFSDQNNTKTLHDGAVHTYIAWCSSLGHRQRKFIQVSKK